jgi:LuxR family quorum-sensing system transcriptional regulator CciR
MFDRVDAFVRDIRKIESEAALGEAIAEIVADLGFNYFALTHHVDLRRSSAAIRIHNYPAGWAEWFDEQALGITDPVHRASNMTSVGFSWSKLADMIPLTRNDRRILNLARAEGIGDGYTVPSHVPGEAHGSCSFACAAGAAFAEEHFNSLQLVGIYAFEAARSLRRREFATPPVRLTDRQRDVVLWAATGKSDKEIARLLGITEDTVGEHMRNVCQRYGVKRRTSVAISALFDGVIGFQDVLPKR